ncbi:Altered inheritance of mitochondria protein 9 [Dirofilaria immitis]
MDDKRKQVPSLYRLSSTTTANAAAANSVCGKADQCLPITSRRIDRSCYGSPANRSLSTSIQLNRTKKTSSYLFTDGVEIYIKSVHAAYVSAYELCRTDRHLIDFLEGFSTDTLSSA